MNLNEQNNLFDVLVIGAGPAGLSAAISAKTELPDAKVCVIDKGIKPGSHNLSGAAIESQPLEKLLAQAKPDWRNSPQAKEMFARQVKKENVLFLAGGKLSLPITFAVNIAKRTGLGIGQMQCQGDYIVSISRLCGWLSQIAKEKGVEVITSFAANDLTLNSNGLTETITLIDQGLDKTGSPQPNYIRGEQISAKIFILAEGCDGLLTEKFIEKAGLSRKREQLFSLGVKEIIKVSDEQYKKFGDSTVIKTLGYPLWFPVTGPAIFGGGVMYSCGDNQIMTAVIVALDWKYCNFNPQIALALFKEHRFVKQFIAGGTVIEAGAKMIPEGGLLAVPRENQTGNIGKANTIIIGDSAGFVNMLKIKGLHCAIESGLLAGKAIAQSFDSPQNTASSFTNLFNASPLAKELYSARKFRQLVAKSGNLFGFPLSVLSPVMPNFKIEKDYRIMTRRKFRYNGGEFDKATFVALSGTRHREEQPCHLTILDGDTCINKCMPKFDRPCITFCPAGVYETVEGRVTPANPSNCLHCKSCQRKCPFGNIRWTAPEGAGGPNYRQM